MLVTKSGDCLFVDRENKDGKVYLWLGENSGSLTEITRPQDFMDTYLALSVTGEIPKKLSQRRNDGILYPSLEFDY